MDKEKHIETEKETSNIEYNIICEFIRLRKEANMSQQDIADQSNIIRTTVARIENGMNSPQMKTMLQILEPLGFTLKIEKIKKEVEKMYQR